MNSQLEQDLRRCASDRRWRIREAVAMALQRLGDVDMDALVQAMTTWSTGAPLEQRAAAAALCEPRLLGQAKHTRAVLRILDKITASVHRVENRKSEDFRAAQRSGLLLECCRGRIARRGQAADGQVAGGYGPRCALDHEGELEEESPRSCGCGL
jgi:hypothetical protein